MTGHFRYLIFTILFFTLSVYGNFVYCGVFVSFVVLVYVLSIIPVYFDGIKSFLRKNAKIACVTVLMILTIIMSLSFYYVKYGDSEISYSFGTREDSGEVSLKTFLTYGGSEGISKYKEVIRRYGKSIDINLYLGFFLPVFVVISIFNCRDRLSFAVAVTALIVFLFSIGSFVSVLFYYLYPLGKFFRHVGLTATVFKLFIVFYAGFGFEEFFTRLFKENEKRNFFILTSLIVIVSLLSLTQYVKSPADFRLMSKAEEVFFSAQPYVTLTVGVLLSWLIYKTKLRKKYLINLILLLIVFDFFFYKYSLIISRMPRVSNEVISLFEPYEYGFPTERLPDTKAHLNNNSRAGEFFPVLKFNENFVSIYNAVYNTVDSFLFTDSATSSYRTDFVLEPIRCYYEIKEKFPNDNGIYEKYSGVNYPKVGIFSKLNFVDDESEMGKIFNLSDFTGDMLLTIGEEIEDMNDISFSNIIQRQMVANFENQDERISAKIDINEFTFNSLDLKVTVNGPENGYCFLYYADVYHPHWNAYVNGDKTPVIRSNIGYKSIMIPYGTSEVVFKFGNIFYHVSFLCTMIMNLFIIISIIYIFITEMIVQT